MVVQNNIENSIFYCDSVTEMNKDQITQFITGYLSNVIEVQSLRLRMVRGGEQAVFLAKILSVKVAEVMFSSRRLFSTNSTS